MAKSSVVNLMPNPTFALSSVFQWFSVSELSQLNLFILRCPFDLVGR